MYANIQRVNGKKVKYGSAAMIVFFLYFFLYFREFGCDDDELWVGRGWGHKPAGTAAHERLQGRPSWLYHFVLVLHSTKFWRGLD